MNLSSKLLLTLVTDWMVYSEDKWTKYIGPLLFINTSNYQLLKHRLPMTDWNYVLKLLSLTQICKQCMAIVPIQPCSEASKQTFDVNYPYNSEDFLKYVPYVSISQRKCLEQTGFWDYLLYYK